MMNEWDGFKNDRFGLATISITLDATRPLFGTTTGGFTQPMTTPLAAASLGEDLFQSLQLSDEQLEQVGGGGSDACGR